MVYPSAKGVKMLVVSEALENVARSRERTRRAASYCHGPIMHTGILIRRVTLQRGSCSHPQVEYPPDITGAEGT